MLLPSSVVRRRVQAGILTVGFAIVLAAGWGASGVAGAGATSVAPDRAQDRPAAVRDFWTADRMRRAEPAGQHTPVGFAHAGLEPRERQLSGGTSFASTELDPTLPGNRSNGRLFFTHSGGSGLSHCSGAVVDAANQSVVVTAGHCVLGEEETDYSENVMFVPGYYDGRAPFGKWFAERLLTTGQWIAQRNMKYDFAAVVLDRGTTSRAVEDVVGGQPIAFNQPRDQIYREIAYPGAPTPPYDGERMFQCESAYRGDVEAVSGGVPYEGPKLISIGCDQEAGSSGGAWLNPEGFVTTVTSNGIPAQQRLIGPYLDDVAASVFNSAATATLETPKCHGLSVTQMADDTGDTLLGTGQDDVILAGRQSDLVIGGAGNDTICGGGGGDSLKGGGGKDRLFGEAGKDRINGGAGKDVCRGGPAQDQFSKCP